MTSDLGGVLRDALFLLVFGAVGVALSWGIVLPDEPTRAEVEAVSQP